MIDFRTGTRAVIFDLDGVIADTEPLHQESFVRVLREVGIDPAVISDWHRFIGSADKVVLLELMKNHPVREEPDVLLERKATYFLELVRQRPPVFPAIPKLVADLASNYQLGVASGSLRTAIAGILELHGLRRFFGPTVSVQDVERPKPAPDLFLRASNLLGIPPEACVVIEDSVPGVGGARAAGMRVIAVTNTTPAERLAHADAVVSDYAAVRRLLLPDGVPGHGTAAQLAPARAGN